MSSPHPPTVISTTQKIPNVLKTVLGTEGQTPIHIFMSREFRAYPEMPPVELTQAGNRKLLETRAGGQKDTGPPTGVAAGAQRHGRTVLQAQTAAGPESSRRGPAMADALKDGAWLRGPWTSSRH